MHGQALKYLLVESTASGIVNGVLNCAAAFLLFHGRSLIPVSGPPGLVRDSIGEVFLVVSLSYMAAALVSRHRRRTGKLPEVTTRRGLLPGNLYLWSVAIGILFTCVLVPINALLLPLLYPNGVTLRNVVLFKTLFGAVLGAIATGLGIYRALNEVQPLPDALVH